MTLATGIPEGTDAFCEAAAIVEAEMLRFEHDLALWEIEIAELSAEESRPRACVPCTSTCTSEMHRSGSALTGLRRHWRAVRHDARVWPTQRSPPSR